MLRFLVRLFAAIGFIIVVFAIGAGVWIMDRLDRAPTLPQAIVLELDLNRALPENGSADPLAALIKDDEASLHEIVLALDRGSLDPRVKGVIARLGGDQFGLAQAQELRGALSRFRATGRFAVAFAESYGEFGPGNASYYLAAGFDEVWLQPVGMVGLTGLVAQVPFVRGTLDKLDIVPELAQRAEYKTFMNTFSERGFTEPHREMVESIVAELTEQLVAGIAEGRGLPAATVRDLIDRGPLTDREALEEKLVDHLGYADELRSAARDRAGPDSGIIEVLDYLDAAGRSGSEGAAIALIHGTGAILQGESRFDPLLGGATMGADSVVEAFDEAIEEPTVRAIVFRIDSGGGSAVASETIRRAVLRARGAGKPVIVSMGETAASGGYWIALGADRVVAHPATLTGSIGVVAGKMVTDELWEELGVNWGQVALGRNATMWSTLSRYSDSEQRRLTVLLDDMYQAFIREVAEARKMPSEAVEDIARGRVWTGSQAESLGLVDSLGGLHDALIQARALAGLSDDAPVETFPRPESPFRKALELAFPRHDLGSLRLTDLAPLFRDLPLPANSGALRIPPIGLQGP